MQADSSKSLAAEQWYGYGHWDAPFWFIGKEPGGADDPEQYDSWIRLGGTELIDCREHDLDCAKHSAPLWHGPRPGPNLQPTWRPLIALTLAFQGAAEWDIEAGRRYQDERWGTLTGDTAILDLSAVAAKSVNSTESLRLAYLDQRIETFQNRIEETAPQFVVFYGLGRAPIDGNAYLEYWRAIAGVDLQPGIPRLRKRTIFPAMPHPTAPGTTTADWTSLGQEIRKIRRELDAALA